MSKLVPDSRTAMFPPRLPGWVPAHVARFPTASAHFVYSRALFGVEPSPGQQEILQPGPAAAGEA